MNDQSQMMNQHQMMNPAQGQMMVSQGQMAANQPKMMVSQAQMAAKQPTMMNYGQWSRSMPPPPMNFANPMIQNQFVAGIAKPGRSSNINNNWKGKKPMDKRKDARRKDKASLSLGVGVGGLPSAGAVSYQPPTLYELEQQNRLKARRFYHPKKKFNRMGPYAHAPRNTTSYIIRAKKSGGIASLVSPCPVTPAVLPTPVFSPSREALVDMAKEEWGVDGYGSMKGLIRLRSPGHDEAVDDYDEEDDGGSSESDVEEHVEVERRLDHDLSRFEMIYPNSGADYHNVLENRVDDQDTHIAQLEEENLILKERLYLMERELGELRRRLLCLERQNQVVEDINEEVVENVSENDSEGLRNAPLFVHKHNEEVDSLPGNYIQETSGETLHKELKELSVKQVFDNEMMTSYGIDDKQDNNGLGYRLMVGSQDEEHSEELPRNVEKALSEHQQPQNNNNNNNCKDVGSPVRNEVDNIKVAVERQSAGDAYMGESLLDEDNENDKPEGEVNDRTGINMNRIEAVVGGAGAVESNHDVNNESAEDICMGDSTDRDIKDVEPID